MPLVHIFEPGAFFCKELKSVFYYFKYIHWTCLCADTAGNTFGSRISFGFNDQAEWTCFCTFAASCTFLFVDHINALGILCDCAFRTCFCAFATLRAGHRTNSFLFCDLQTCQSRIICFLESLRTCNNTFQTGHTGTSLFNFKFFH